MRFKTSGFLHFRRAWAQTLHNKCSVMNVHQHNSLCRFTFFTDSVRWIYTWPCAHSSPHTTNLESGNCSFWHIILLLYQSELKSQWLSLLFSWGETATQVLIGQRWPIRILLNVPPWWGMCGVFVFWWSRGDFLSPGLVSRRPGVSVSAIAALQVSRYRVLCKFTLQMLL